MVNGAGWHALSLRRAWTKGATDMVNGAGCRWSNLRDHKGIGIPDTTLGGTLILTGSPFLPSLRRSYAGAWAREGACRPVLARIGRT